MTASGKQANLNRVNSGYAKLFSTIVTSTIWREDDKTRVLWITMLAICDKFGIVAASVPGLAAVANLTLPDCEAALDRLSSPDKYSRTREHEGRRIEARDGGWKILNYGKYRELGRSVERREYLRIKQQESRARRAGQQTSTLSTTSTDINRSQPISEADATAEADLRTRKSVGGDTSDPSKQRDPDPAGAPARVANGRPELPPQGKEIPPRRPVHIGAATDAFLRVYEAYPNRNAKMRAAQAFQDLAPQYGGEEAFSRKLLVLFSGPFLKQHPFNGEARFVPTLAAVLEERRFEDAVSTDRATVVYPKLTRPGT